MSNTAGMQVCGDPGAESPVEMYARVYRQLKPCGALPAIEASFCRLASANSVIRMQEGRITVKITDLLDGAPAPVTEALAFVLLEKLLHLPVPAKHNSRYRRHPSRCSSAQHNLVPTRFAPWRPGIWGRWPHAA